MSFAVTFGTSAAGGMLLLSNLKSQNPEISGVEDVCCASATSEQRNTINGAESKDANRMDGVFIGVVRELQWIAAATGRWNHTTLRKRTYRQDPYSKCTRTS